MDILTKVKMDHCYIHSLLQEVISKVKGGDVINNLIQDLLEEIREHMNAEKVCLSEMFLEKEKRGQPFSSQMGRDTILNLFSDKLYQEFDKSFESKELKNKFYFLEKLLGEHSQCAEDAILLLSKECIDGQKSEELCLKFEEEKVKTLISGITYA